MLFVPSRWIRSVLSRFAPWSRWTLAVNARSKLPSPDHRSNHRQTEPELISGFPVSGFVRMGIFAHGQPVWSWYKMELKMRWSGTRSPQPRCGRERYGRKNSSNSCSVTSVGSRLETDAFRFDVRCDFLVVLCIDLR